MLKEYKYPIKVDPKITPISTKDRIVPHLKIGERYYISFQDNWAYPCQLLEIINEFSETEVKVQIELKAQFSYIRKNGMMNYEPFQQCTIYACEIGSTPEDAVKNTVRN